MAVKRFFYYALLTIAGIFFLAHIIFGWAALRSGGDPLTKSTAALVLFVVFFISQSDRAYLIKSIPLRIIMGVTCGLGLIVVAVSMRLA